MRQFLDDYTGKGDDLHFYLLDKLQSLSSSNRFPTWEYQSLIKHLANNQDRITYTRPMPYWNVGSLPPLPPYTPTPTQTPESKFET